MSRWVFVCFLCAAFLLSSVTGYTESSLRIWGNSLQFSLTSAVKEELPKLGSNKSELDTVLESFAEAIVDDVSDVVLYIFDQPPAQINAKDIALEFSSAVNQSFLESESFEKVDWDSVSQQVEVSVERILCGIDATSESLTITEKLVNVVVTAIGDGLSQVTGEEFSYKFTLSESSILIPSSSSSPSPVLSTSISLVALLDSGDILVVKKQIQKLLKSGGGLTVLEFFITVTNTQALYTPMAEVFTIIFKDAKFPFELMSDRLQVAYEFNTNITIIIEEAIEDSVLSKQYAGLIQFISIGLDMFGLVNDAVLKSLEGVVQDLTCTPLLADILVQSKDIAKSQTNFQLGILGSAELTDCLSLGIENQFSNSIVEQLSGEQVSNKKINSVFASLQPLTVNSVSEILVKSIEEGNATGVEKLLIKYYEDESVTSEKLGLLITAMVSANQTSIVLQSISKTENMENLIRAFDFEFFAAKEFSLKLFVELIEDSVENGECGLSEILNGVFFNATAVETSYINQLLVEGGAAECAMIQPTTEIQPATQPALEEPKIILVLEGENKDECRDIAPDSGEYSCAQQAAWGKCDAQWMIDAGYCRLTCGRCCRDVPPNQQFTCQQQKQFGKCEAGWMQEQQYCQQTCGRCQLPSTASFNTPTEQITNKLRMI